MTSVVRQHLYFSIPVGCFQTRALAGKSQVLCSATLLLPSLSATNSSIAVLKLKKGGGQTGMGAAQGKMLDDCRAPWLGARSVDQQWGSTSHPASSAEPPPLFPLEQSPAACSSRTNLPNPADSLVSDWSGPENAEQGDTIYHKWNTDCKEAYILLFEPA